VVAEGFGAVQLGDLPELTNGFAAVFLGAAAIAVVGAAITAIVMRSTKVDDPRPVQSTVNS